MSTGFIKIHKFDYSSAECCEKTTIRSTTTKLTDEKDAVSRRWGYSIHGILTLRLLISYIYGAPSKARNVNVVYIWTYVWQRRNSLFLFAAQLIQC